MKYFILILFLLTSGLTFSQGTDSPKSGSDYYREDYLRYADFVYVDYIQTLITHREGDELADPVILLNSNERISCSFDDLRGGVENYVYTFIHCDAAWKPSELLTSEFLEGYREDYIRDYRFSFNTLQTYTHYQVVFPGEQMKLKISGNYLLLVYPENKPDNPVVTARFYVTENAVRLEGKVRQAIDLEERYEKQQVQFKIFTDNYPIVNPFQNLHVVLKQNGREDTRITNLKPVMIKGSEIDYMHVTGNVFDGGNEFRHFDNKSIKYPSDRVQKIEPSEGVYQAWLMPDERRSQKSYITEDDINGRRVIRTSDGTDPDIEADYLDVHFFLPFSPFYSNGNFYVLGELTQWELTKKSQMTYNFNRKGYEFVRKLKQGYYNYAYVLVENGRKSGDISFIEGNHFETGNDYRVYIYYKEPGTLYDKLIAFDRWK